MKRISLAFIAVLALACSLTNTIDGIPTFSTDTPVPSPMPTSTTPAKACTVTATHLNMRESPGITARVLTVLDFGEPVNILSSPAQGNWIPVNARGKDGWINQIYCTQETEK